jgi:hypothetical protein
VSSTPEPAPAVGDSVHYVSEGSPVRLDGTQKYRSTCRAAVVTEVTAGPKMSGPGPASCAAGLFVMTPNGTFSHSLAEGGCEYAPGGCAGAPRPGGGRLAHPGGSWHWASPSAG